MEIALALTSAFLFALGSVLQQKAGLDGPAAGSSSGLLLRMARRPVWIAGIACDGLGFVAKAAALGIGSLAVVQPLLVTSVVFALPLGVWLTGQRVRRAEVAAAAVVVVALAVFLIVANASGGKNEAPLRDWLIAAGVCGVTCAPLVFLGRSGPPRHRSRRKKADMIAPNGMNSNIHLVGPWHSGRRGWATGRAGTPLPFLYPSTQCGQARIL